MYIAGVKIDEELSFDEIDQKVKYINENKKYCEETIRELNTLIDLDYIKASEFIEGNTLREMNEIEIDDNTKVMRACQPFIIDMPSDKTERKAYLKNLRYDSDKNSLIIMKKGNDSALDFRILVCEVPKHLSALETALSKARSDRNTFLKSGGKMPPVTKQTVQEINAKFFEKTEHKNEPGYGTYRRVVFENGRWIAPNVEVGGATWKPMPCEIVPEEMDNLLDFYNRSDAHPILKAIIFKTKFIRIHPFRDGNGRTSRILLNYMLVRYGYPTITITGKEKYSYFNSLQKAITENNYTDLVKLIMKHLNTRCDKYIQVINEQKAIAEEEEKQC